MKKNKSNANLIKMNHHKKPREALVLESRNGWSLIAAYGTVKNNNFKNFIDLTDYSMSLRRRSQQYKSPNTNHFYVNTTNIFWTKLNKHTKPIKNIEDFDYGALKSHPKFPLRRLSEDVMAVIDSSIETNHKSKLIYNLQFSGKEKQIQKHGTQELKAIRMKNETTNATITTPNNNQSSNEDDGMEM
ncbi:hypothetical protein [Williamsoniiplasma luminosum]|nr:hypothetical protein [Williamsoniiplasma luminosum]